VKILKEEEKVIFLKLKSWGEFHLDLSFEIEFSRTNFLSPTSDDNYLSKNDASTQVLYLNNRTFSDFFQNENC